MNSNNYIVEFQDIAYTGSLGRIVFDGLNFGLSAGETAIISGSVGKGKTSLVELIIAQKKPVSGLIRVFDDDLIFGKESVQKEIRRKIGGVGGIFGPISYQTVYDNMKYPLLFRGLFSGDSREKIMRSLSAVNLLGKKNIKVSDLSRGEKMLLMLSRAIVAEQPLLLIDEPLAGLDEQTAGFINAMLNRLSVAGHSIIILTSGQTGLEIANATHYTILNGQLI